MIKHSSIFIEGAALDAKGSSAEAILEYQEALQAEPNAAISLLFLEIIYYWSKFNRARTAAKPFEWSLRTSPTAKILELFFPSITNRFSCPRVRRDYKDRFKLYGRLVRTRTSLPTVATSESN